MAPPLKAREPAVSPQPARAVIEAASRIPVVNLRNMVRLLCFDISPNKSYVSLGTPRFNPNAMRVGHMTIH
jgi:hypothetical protein